MKSETKELARQIYASIMTTATGLGSVSKEERTVILKDAARLCLEAAAAFESVENEISG